jgi:hypothetical protein
VLRLYVEEGRTYSEIASELGITRQRVGQIVKEALEDAAERKRELADLLIARELDLIGLQLRLAQEILLAECQSCENHDDLRPGCKTCRRTGYRYPVGRRMAAIDRQGDAQERRIRLLGLDRAPALALAVAENRSEFYRDLERVPDADLQAELARLLHPEPPEQAEP